MAFDKEVYSDGESTYEVPYWRKTIEYIDANVDTFSYEKETELRSKIQEDEVGIKHPKNDSFIKIKDNGEIEMFVGTSSGVRLKNDGSIQFFGDSQFIGNKFQGITKSNESDFNGEKLSGSYPSLRDKGKSDELVNLKKEVGGINGL